MIIALKLHVQDCTTSLKVQHQNHHPFILSLLSHCPLIAIQHVHHQHLQSLQWLSRNHQPNHIIRVKRKKSRLNHSDLGAFVHSSHSSIADNDKYHLIREYFVPTLAYNFPQSSSRRSFQYSWLSKFQWLRYSEQDDGGYCLPCVLFFRPTVSFRTAPEVLVTKPLTNFQKALAILKKHESRPIP